MFLETKNVYYHVALCARIFPLPASVAAARCSNSSQPQSFEEWCSKYGKTYLTREEWSARKKVFYQNADLVWTLNAEHR